MDLFDIAVAKRLAGGGGGSAVIESLSVTENGTYTAPSGVDGYSPVTVDVSGGGGSSNVVTGTFTGTEDGTNHAEDVAINYSGNGYPLFCVIAPKGGLKGNTAFDALIKRYAVALYAIQKADESLSPKWTGTAPDDQSIYVDFYKNSTSSSTAYSQSASFAGAHYKNIDATPNSGALKIVYFKDNKTMSVWISKEGLSEAHGFPSGIEYEYVIAYSS